MEKPVLVVLAAGMGSRYGGLKQMDPVGPNGEVIIDYSIYDAIAAGFEKVIFIIKHQMEADFYKLVGNRLAKQIKVEYAFQEVDMLPEGFEVPKERLKPWGTTHALLAAKPLINGPFAVINADDYYGSKAYEILYEFLSNRETKEDKAHFAMVGYLVENTVTQHGTVARGVCEANTSGYLESIVERLKVARTESGGQFTEDDGETWQPLPAGTLVSMNFWGLDRAFLDAAEKGFPDFLKQNLPVNPHKCEYLLPSSVDAMLKTGKAHVKVLKSGDVWYGVTYKEDKPAVQAAIRAKHESGQYPTPLWKNA